MRKNLKLITAGFLASIVSLSTGLFSNLIPSGSLKANDVALKCDPILSDRICQQLQKQLIADSVRSYSSKVMCHRLINDFPFISELESSREGLKNRTIVIRASDPLIIINNILVMTHQGVFVPKEVYTPSTLQTLGSLTVAQVDHIQRSAQEVEQLKNFIEHHAYTLLDAYCVTWIDPTRLLLTDKQDDWFSILCDTSSIPDCALIKRCTAIKHQLQTQQGPTGQKVALWAADVRFKNQIVLFRKKEGIA